MSDETDDSEVKQLMMQSAEPVPIKVWHLLRLLLAVSLL